MAESEFKTFEDFWPFYLGEHADSTNRKLHVFGTTAALTVAATVIATRKWKALPLALVAGYGPAWVGHFIIEGNRPATFKHPLWSLRGDFKMNAMAWTGKLQNELERLDIEPNAIES